MQLINGFECPSLSSASNAKAGGRRQDSVWKHLLMMGTKGSDQDRLFYSFNLDEHDPADHLLRPNDLFLDLSELRRHLIRAGRYHILVAPHQVDLPADSRT